MYVCTVYVPLVECEIREVADLVLLSCIKVLSS